ncbi:unnamed protein product [Moneuplotes crassus]|uniref:FCP1 homology domain-containing protein n=1 Tax=Euplotes crassus TaxID=5936 RepID=A0AAD1Y2U2_EUPCR|nr:unnamed protein product [Moneuplotes crassus]
MASYKENGLEPSINNNHSLQNSPESESIWDEADDFFSSEDTVFKEPRSSQIKVFYHNESGLSKNNIHKLCEKSDHIETPQFQKSKYKDKISKSFGGFVDGLESSPFIGSTAPDIRKPYEIFDDGQKFIQKVRTTFSFEEESKVQVTDNEMKPGNHPLGFYNDSKVLFIKLEEVLICNSDLPLPNLKLLTTFDKGLDEDSEDPDEVKEETFHYLRPFCVPFLKYIKQGFNIVVYTYLPQAVFEEIFDELERLVGEDLFSSLMCFPQNSCKTGQAISTRKIDDFFSISENRNIENCFFIDSSHEFCEMNRLNCIPMPSFGGDPKDCCLFLCQKYIQNALDADIELTKVINESFS